MPKISRDLDFLMTCFREVLEELGEHAIAKCLPWVGSEQATPDARLGDRLAQAYSTAFTLLGMVEENAYAQEHRSLQRAGRLRQASGSWEATFDRLASAGYDAAAIADRLPSVHVEPVLTAHPTEAKRATIREHQRELYLLLVSRENQMWTPGEQQDIRNRIKAIIELLWRTGAVAFEKPDVASEVRNVVHYLRHVFPTVLPLLNRRLHDAWEAAGLDPALIEDRWPLLPRLSFGDWVGGDRDGHPLVSADITRYTLNLLRSQAIDLIREHLVQLARRLSISSRQHPPDQPLMDRIDALAAGLGAAWREAIDRNPEEPWRQFVNLMLAMLPDARLPTSTTSAAYTSATELSADLELLRQSLIRCGARRLARIEVIPVAEIARTFGFHLAALDIRQNSRFHDVAVSQLLAAAGSADSDFAGWPEPRRREFLERELASPRPFARADATLGWEARAVLDCYGALGEQLATHGADGLGALIVSMAHSLSDLLVVYLLARERGVLQHDGDGAICRLPVVQLFETIDDLRRAPDIVSEFLAHPITRRSLPLWAAAQGASKAGLQVMIGYSDSNKDGGILASMWSLCRAQVAMAAAAGDTPIRFFHGRGGTISRGAGPTHRFLDALPSGSVAGDLRLTEQGEVVAQKYANRITAAHNLELLTAGAVRRTLLDGRTGEDGSPLAAVLDRLTETSRRTYRQLVDADGFVTFFAEATPIDVIEQSRIGSRPARRTGQRTVADLRAIPWVFSWSQARFYISGWYGLGSALAELESADPCAFAALVAAQRSRTWPTFRYIVGNAATSLAAADPQVMSAYADLVRDPQVRERFLSAILAEYATTRAAVEALFGRPLDQERPALSRAIRLRAPGLAVLHNQQIDLLRTWRAAAQAGEGDDADQLFTRLLLSVNAIASGLGTTG